MREDLKIDAPIIENGFVASGFSIGGNKNWYFKTKVENMDWATSLFD